MRIRFGRNITMALACAVLLAAAVPLNADGPPRYSPWSEAVQVGPPISLTMPGYFIDDIYPVISKNDLDLYFTSWSAPAGPPGRPGGKGGYDIWVSHRDTVDDPWETPINLPVNTSKGEFFPFVTIDGHWLYFVSNRPGGQGGRDLWVSHRQDKRDDQGWEEPKNLGPVVNSTSTENAPVLFEDETTGKILLYFSSDRPGGMGNMDLYVSSMVGDNHEIFSPPVPVFELNTEYLDSAAFLGRKDGLEIIFSSNRPGPGTTGNIDLWTATRPDTSSPWSTLVPLGTEVNSKFDDAVPSISWNGTTLYFNSDPSGTGVYHLYKATRTKLPD